MAQYQGDIRCCKKMGMMQYNCAQAVCAVFAEKKGQELLKTLTPFKKLLYIFQALPKYIGYKISKL